MSTEKKLYTVQAGYTVRAGGKNYSGGAGDASNVQLSDADAKRLMDDGRIVPAGKGAKPAAVDATNVLEGTVSDVTAALDTMNADQLKQLAKDEKAGKARVGVLDAIESALARTEA